ncbi:TPA: hypothetical protein DCW38_05575 [candidate division WOR-3 bacterium]|jgi:RNA polymerase sigma-70 factor (ECF subfamily)|uniref:RNA polymerase sigma factor n=1 Tax=candidate division WOR-3 bacterium TaxID=2052148 RepID=A0A350HAR8_UNCW3|nr:hypothetical protein [candidate division WOR-3 bacterium]
MEIAKTKIWEKKTAGIAVNKTHRAGGASAPPIYMEYPILNDEQLIDLVMKQDQQAFKEIFGRYSKKIFNLAFSYVGDYHYAEEITQDIFVTIYGKSSSFKKTSSFSTWIYRIAVNASVSHLRKHKKDLMLCDMESAEDLSEEPIVPEPPDRKETANILLKSLPESQRMAFILSQKDNLKYKEISAIMKISEKAVESLIYRARENLRRSIREMKSSETLKENL